PTGTRRVIVMAAADPETLHYPPWIWRETARVVPARWSVLSMAQGPMLLVRPDPFTLEVRALGPAFLARAVEDMYLSPGSTSSEGDERDGAGLVATVEVAEAGHPRQIRFRFDRSLDAP